ncbi:MAG TPA: hypothetical protein VMT33_03980, partial [Candidatus Bathyarchaeia archaeon]|nr:hypothetical protein [Candidatus Bathyarchaeia archaeon]
LVVESGTFALQGALKALDLLETTAATLSHPFSVRAVGTMFDKRLRIARELLVGMHAQLGGLLFDTAIRTSVRLRETAAAGVPVNVLDPASRAADDFRSLAAEVRAHRAALGDGGETEREHWLTPQTRRQVSPRKPGTPRQRAARGV